MAHAHLASMSLTPRQKALLNEIVTTALNLSEGIDAARFRASHEDDLADLDLLEQQLYIERKDNRYFPKIAALADLAKTSGPAERILYLCQHLYKSVRSSYKENPGTQILVQDLATAADLPISDVRKGLRYLIQTPIWSGWTTDLGAPKAFVTPSETVLKHKTFDSVLTEMRRVPDIPAHPPISRVKQQKFGILDAPNLLAADIAQPSGPLGKALIYLDIDDFKKINTRLTESVVDEVVLPKMHMALAECVGRLGNAYGEGGDEFVVLLLNFSERMAIAFAEDLRQNISRIRFSGAGADIAVTASLGLAHAPANTDPADLKKYANEAKKFAKQNGKNFVAVRAADGTIAGAMTPGNNPQPVAGSALLSAIRKRRATTTVPAVEGVEQRTRRIVKVLRLQYATTGDVVFNNPGKKSGTIAIPTAEGGFELYFLLDDAGSNIEEYWYVAPIASTFRMEKVLADIRVLLAQLTKLQAFDLETKVCFVIATNEDISSVAKVIDTKFKKMKAIAKLSVPAKFRILLWDKSGIARKEREIGLQI